VAGQDPKIQIDITARDKASEVIDEVAAAADHVEKLDPEVKVTADTATATADLKEVQDASDRVANNDTVLVIKAKIDQAKGQIEDLKSSLGDVDEAATNTGDTLGTEVEKGTTKAGGAVHSMAGNVLGDSAAMATGFGPLGEALGQITEGALGGEVALTEMLSAGLGLAAITVVVGSIQKGLQANKDIDAFNKKKIEDFTQSLRAGQTALEALNKEFTDTGKVTFVDAGDGKTKDLTKSLADAGLTMDQFTAAVALGKEGFKQWVIAHGEAIGAGGDLNAIIQAGTQYVNDAAAANKAYTDQQFVMGATTAETARETAKLTAGVIDAGQAARDALRPINNAADGVAGFATDAAAADENYRRLIGALDEQDAWATVNQAVKDYNENTKHSDEDTRNLIRTVADYVNATDTIPESKKTQIFADLSSGDVKKIESDMTELTRDRDIQILLKAVGSADTIKLLRTISRGGTGIVDEATVTSSSAPNVTVNMPRGARYSDIARAVGFTTRRNGRRFGVVNR